MKTFALLIAIGLLALASVAAPGAPALAQARAADPEGALNDELIVRARAPGPAWWKAGDGASTVWILGVPTGLSKDVAWNDTPLQARLKQAHVLILPPEAKIGPLRAIAFFLGHRKAFRSPQPLEQTLPAPLAERFAAVREKLGKPASRYAGWRPAVAAVILSGDLRAQARLRQGEPEDHIRALGRQAGVREQPAGSFGPAMLQALVDLPDNAHRQCLEDSVDESEAGAGRIVEAGRGWAAGDVRAALGVERGFDRCLAALPEVSALILQGQGDSAAAIKDALAKPGVSVAVVELRSLLAKGGVIDRLRADGVHIETPDRD